jgi:hypothetical protein
MTETPAPQRILTAEEVYGPDWDDEAVEAALDESLAPRSLMDLMYGLVAEADLPPGSLALDVGAREGFHCFELSRRFGLTVRGLAAFAVIWTTPPAASPRSPSRRPKPPPASASMRESPRSWKIRTAASTWSGVVTCSSTSRIWRPPSASSTGF